MNRTLKIGLTSGLGGLIGSLVALSLNQYFWWLGLVVGGLTGYFSYEFRQVGAAARNAWVNILRQYSKKDIKSALSVLNIMILIIANIVIPLFLPLVCMALVKIPDKVAFPMWLLYIGFYLGIITFLNPQLRLRKGSWHDALIYINPFVVVPYRLVKIVKVALVGAISMLRDVLPKIVPFAKAVLIQIHSECRMICLVYGAVGTLAGYVFGSVLIGTAVGFFGGIATYEIVSKRILGIVQCRE